MKLFSISGFRFSIVALLFFLASPAFAQRDSLKMAEALTPTVIRKAEAKPAVKPAEKGPTIKESLAIEHKNDARKDSAPSAPPTPSLSPP